MHTDRKAAEGSSVTISLILPAWNESEVIESAIAEADAALAPLAHDYEVIVVDDGSSDDTAALVRAVAQHNPAVRLIQHSPNQGYGAALRSGFAAARKDLVVFTDADCQFDLTELDRFVLLSQRYDIVCGYRIDRKDTALRCLYSKAYNQLVRILLGTGVRDVDCALKMFHRDIVQQLKIEGDGFLVNSEILTQAKQRGHSVVEVGVSHRPRTAGNSTVSIRHIPKVLSSLLRYWWNEVQFPARPMPINVAPPPTSNSAPTTNSAPTAKLAKAGWLQIALLLVAAMFLFSNLGYPLIDRDETRYAEIPREMLVTGNWILPQLNFQTYYDKPPMLYWLCAISYKLFGIHETAARLVPALAAFLTIAATMWFGTRNFGSRIGLLSGVVLLLTAGFAFTSRYLLLDGVMSLFVCLSLFTAYEAIRGGGTHAGGTHAGGDYAGGDYASFDHASGANVGRAARVRLGWWLASGVFCGLAFLTKGPLALVLWLPPVAAFTWLSSGYAKPRWWHYGLIGLATAIVAGPWFVAVSLQDATFVEEFFIQHNVRRFAGDFHERPFWYFLPVLLIAGHPWSFLTIPYARFLSSHAQQDRCSRTPAIGFLLLCSVWTFGFFSMSRCKLPTYLLPAAPAMALMIAHYLDQVLRDSSTASTHWFARFWSARTATATTCLAGVGFVVYIVISELNVSMFTFLWAMLWTGLLASSLVLLNDRRQAKLAWASSSVVAFLLAVMVMHQTLPAYSRGQTLFGAGAVNMEHAAAAIDSESPPPLATVAHEFSGVPFYLQRSDIVNFAAVEDQRLRQFVQQQRRVILVVDANVTTQQLASQLPANSSVHPLGRRGVANIVEVLTPPPTTRVAAGEDAVLQ